MRAGSYVTSRGKINVYGRDGVLSDDVISSNVCNDPYEFLVIYCVILLVMVSYLFAFLA